MCPAPSCQPEPPSPGFQPLGAVVLLDADGARVRAVDEGGPERIGCAGLAPGADLARLLPEVAAARASVGPAHGELRETLDVAWTGPQGRFEVVLQRRDDREWLEFLPAGAADPDALRRALRRTRAAVQRIEEARSLRSALDATVEALRELSGFDRVVLAEYADDWSAEVVVELRGGALPSLAGLRFPLADSASAVRARLWQGAARLVVLGDSPVVALRGPDEDGPARDSARWTRAALLRGPSDRARRVLEGLGVRAALTLGLVCDGRLWGVLACHDPEPRWFPHELWPLVEELARAAMARVRSERARAVAAKVASLREVEAGLAARLRGAAGVAEALEQYACTLQTFLEADGFAFRVAGRLFGSGRVPPSDFVEELMRVAAPRIEADEYFATDALHHLWPEARAQLPVACGVLVQPVVLHRVCHLLWFRRPTASVIEWAGDPSVVDADGPRRFAPVVERRTDRARPWSPAEIGASGHVLREVLDLIATRALSLERLDADLDAVAGAAGEALGPLRTQQQALDAIGTGAESRHSEHALAFAATSSHRVGAFLDQLLTFTRLRPGGHPADSVDLNATFDQVLADLEAELDRGRAALVVSALPVVVGDAEGLRSLFGSLVRALLGEAARGRALELLVSSEASAEELAVTLAAVGPEGPVPLESLRSRRRGPVSLPLTLARRATELHGGRLEVDVDQGRVTVLLAAPGGRAPRP